MDFLDTSIESLIPVDKTSLWTSCGQNFFELLENIEDVQITNGNIPAEKIDASVLSKDIGLQYSTVQYNTLQYSAVQYSTQWTKIKTKLPT